MANAGSAGELRQAVTASPLENIVALADGRVRLAWGEAAVEREVAEISRLAAAQTASILEAAEREAAQLRAASSIELPAWPDSGVDRMPPATKPQVRSGVRTLGRQERVARKVLIAFVALSLVGVISGSAELAAHGFSFYLFRNVGTGAGNPQNLEENQGPGQPDAPRAQHKASPGHSGG